MKNTSICLSEVELNDYLGGVFSEAKKKETETHLSQCNACLEKFVFAYETVEEFNETKSKGAKPMKSAWKRNIWLVGAIIAFALSFFVPRYFIQLSVATLLLGAKWIFESVNARILIMIYEAWQKGGSEEASKILKSTGSRFNR